MSDSQFVLRDRVATVVSAYVSNHSVAAGDLPALIATVHAALDGLTTGSRQGPDAPQPLTPAQIRKSISADFIVCFENGKPYRSLTRHLRAAYGLSPEGYRAKWGLPVDYPMVAPNYAAMRSRLARDIGLGVARPAQEDDAPKRKGVRDRAVQDF